MKLPPSAMLALAGLISCILAPQSIGVHIAQTPNSPAPQTTPPALVGVSPATFEILKLVRAEVSEDTIVAFIANSGNSYPLSAEQLIYLKNAGVSGRILTAMLSHKPSKAPTAPVNAFNAARISPAPAPPIQDIAASPRSTVYVSPDPNSYNSYYTYYPYYYSTYRPYYPYYYPGWSFSVAYNRGYPYYRYPYYKHYPWHGYKPGHHPAPYYHGGHYGGDYRKPPYHGTSRTPAALPANSRYIGATGRLTLPQNGFYPRGTYIGATGKIGPSSAFYSRGTYVGATGRMGSYRASSPSIGAFGAGGFSRGAAVGRMGGMPSGGGFRGGGGSRR